MNPQQHFCCPACEVTPPRKGIHLELPCHGKAPAMARRNAHAARALIAGAGTVSTMIVRPWAAPRVVPADMAHVVGLT